MKAVLPLLLSLLALGVASVAGQTQLILGGSGNVGTTGSATTYALGTGLTGPLVTVTANNPNSATFNVNAATAASLSSSVFQAQSLSLGASLSTSSGLQISSSASSSLTGVSITVNFPAVGSEISLANSNSLAVLYSAVDASASASSVVRIPPSQVSVNGNNIIFNYNAFGYFYVSQVISTPSAVFFSSSVNATTVLVANSGQNFRVTTGSDTAELAFTNIQASGGTLSVAISGNAAARSTAAVLNGRSLISKVYQFSLTSGALSSASITYGTRNSGEAGARGLGPSGMAWYKWDTTNSAWVVQSSSVSGSTAADGMVTTTASSFSEWSVQYTSSAFTAATSPLLMAMLAAAAAMLYKQL